MLFTHSDIVVRLFVALLFIFFSVIPLKLLPPAPYIRAHLIADGAPSYASNSYFSFSKVGLAGGGDIVTPLLGNMATEVASKDATENLPAFSL